MSTSTIDVVTLLPGPVREQALRLGENLRGRMVAAGIEPAFALGSPFPGAGRHDVCEPHVSLLMLEVGTADIPDAVAALADIARARAPFAAIGEYVTHNPQGAPELFFKVSAEWRELQRAVIDRIEPLRRGRLRPADPAGHSVAALIRTSADPDQVRQLSRYGYDEVYEEAADRFRPHVTLAWPAMRWESVDLSDVSADGLDHVVSEVAVAAMRPYGTCTKILSRKQLIG
jgi:hypothetical protein